MQTDSDSRRCRKSSSNELLCNKLRILTRQMCYWFILCWNSCVRADTQSRGNIIHGRSGREAEPMLSGQQISHETNYSSWAERTDIITWGFETIWKSHMPWSHPHDKRQIDATMLRLFCYVACQVNDIIQDIKKEPILALQFPRKCHVRVLGHLRKSPCNG